MHEKQQSDPSRVFACDIPLEGEQLALFGVRRPFWKS